MSLSKAILGHIYTHLSSLARALSLTHTNTHTHYLLSVSLCLSVSVSVSPSVSVFVSLALALTPSHTRSLSLSLLHTQTSLDRHITIVSGENAHEAEHEFRHGGIYKVEPRNFACQIRGP